VRFVSPHATTWADCTKIFKEMFERVLKRMEGAKLDGLAAIRKVVGSIPIPFTKQ